MKKIQVGIVSFGPSPCDAAIPAVYTRSIEKLWIRLCYFQGTSYFFILYLGLLLMWIGSQRQWKPMEAGNSRAFNYENILYNSWRMFWYTTTSFLNKEALSFSCFCCLFWQCMSNAELIELTFLFLTMLILKLWFPLSLQHKTNSMYRGTKGNSLLCYFLLFSEPNIFSIFCHVPACMQFFQHLAQFAGNVSKLKLFPESLIYLFFKNVKFYTIFHIFIQ